MPARIRLSLIAGVFLLVNACASVPLGTMWALRDFHPSDLAKIEPSDIRIATLVQPGPQQLDVTKSGLVLELTPHDAGEVQTYRFGLMPAASGDSAIPPGEHDAGWQGFALEPDGVTAFRALQPRLATVQDDYKGIILRVDRPAAPVLRAHATARGRRGGGWRRAGAETASRGNHHPPAAGTGSENPHPARPRAHPGDLRRPMMPGLCRACQTGEPEPSDGCNHDGIAVKRARLAAWHRRRAFCLTLPATPW